MRAELRYTPFGDSVVPTRPRALSAEHTRVSAPEPTPGRFPFGAAAGAGILSERAAQKALPRHAIPAPIALYVAQSEMLPSTATNHPCDCAASVGGAR